MSDFRARLALAAALSASLAATRLDSQERGLQRVADPKAGPTLVVRASSQGAAIVPSGGTLKTGDRIDFFASLDQPAFLYVLQFHPDGTAILLYPDSGDAIRAEGEIRIPEAGSSFEVVGEPGEEKVFFIASTRRLQDADGRLNEAVERIKALERELQSTPTVAPSAAQPPPPSVINKPATVVAHRSTLPPPAEFGLATRGRLVKVRTGPTAGGDAVTAGSDGIAILQFGIHHVPREARDDD